MVNVPKIAIEDVNIIRNDSAMFNEVLAHRLGLTPLVSDLDALEGLSLPEDDDWGEYTNGIMFHLNEVGPKVVYSKDLISSDSKIKPVYDTQACPRGILKSDRRSKKIKIVEEHENSPLIGVENCAMCKSCVRASDNGYINVGFKPNDFIFRIETDGAMPPKEVLLKACDVLGEKADKFIRFSEEGGSK